MAPGLEGELDGLLSVISADPNGAVDLGVVKAHLERLQQAAFGGGDGASAEPLDPAAVRSLGAFMEKAEPSSEAMHAACAAASLLSVAPARMQQLAGDGALVRGVLCVVEAGHAAPAWAIACPFMESLIGAAPPLLDALASAPGAADALVDALVTLAPLVAGGDDAAAAAAVAAAGNLGLAVAARTRGGLTALLRAVAWELLVCVGSRPDAAARLAARRDLLRALVSLFASGAPSPGEEDEKEEEGMGPNGEGLTEREHLIESAVGLCSILILRGGASAPAPGDAAAAAAAAAVLDAAPALFADGPGCRLAALVGSRHKTTAFRALALTHVLLQFAPRPAAAAAALAAAPLLRQVLITLLREQSEENVEKAVLILAALSEHGGSPAALEAALARAVAPEGDAAARRCAARARQALRALAAQDGPGPLAAAARGALKASDARVKAEVAQQREGGAPRGAAPACDACGAQGPELRRCGACHAPALLWCSVDCQRKGWKTHKDECKRAQAAAAATAAAAPPAAVPAPIAA
ncbi:MAG: hypothetical protein J3K34DRAFT_521950 [Monoraphidium minutum]|nr:MAG: hypothetical protein J3K34DRAFT_521950 [Monoraphidium minutum]